MLLLRLGVYLSLLGNELVEIGLVALSKALRSAYRRDMGDRRDRWGKDLFLFLISLVAFSTDELVIFILLTTVHKKLCVRIEIAWNSLAIKRIVLLTGSILILLIRLSLIVLTVEYLLILRSPMALIRHILHFLHFTVILLIIILIVECSISSIYVLLYPVNLIEILFSLILDKTRLYASEFTLHRVSLNDGPKTIATSIYPIRSSMESARLQQFIIFVRVFLCNPSIRELISEIIDIFALRSLSIVDPALIVSSLWIEVNDLI